MRKFIYGLKFIIAYFVIESCSFAAPCNFANGITVTLEITEMKGLYKSDGTYDDGYISSDDEGRIYCNRVYDTADLDKTIWTKNKQYIDVEVTVNSSGAIPSGARIVWEVVDPDDPSNERNYSRTARVILDPNDYNGINDDNIGGSDDSDGNDNTGSMDGASQWEEISADYELSSSNETKIKNGISKVRFNASDDAGDNYKITAKIKWDSTSTPCGDVSTGLFTVWKMINLEYVKMSTAGDLPVSEIAGEFDDAFVEMRVSATRTVSDGVIDNGTSPAHQWVMGLDYASARAASYAYATKASGEFSKEGPGWFFVASAHEFEPVANLSKTTLYPSSGNAGDAIANGATITLPNALPSGSNPDTVILWNSTQTSYVGYQVSSLSVDRKVITVYKNDYYLPSNSSSPFLEADLGDYGFPSAVEVTVFSPGAYRIGGISPGLAGKTIVFTEGRDASSTLGTLIHELTHGFGLAHKCGNWAANSSSSNSCCMNYGEWFILDQSSPRTPELWTNHKNGTSLCAPHIKAIREANLEDIVNLGWN